MKLFEQETEVLKFIEHPAIPQYLDYFDVEIDLRKGFALVQTYIEAKSLFDWIQSARSFSFGVTRNQICGRSMLAL
ncbi:MAG: hypothetical protein AAGJ08_11755 [Cyanobacteria bacterium P01_H01_bin.35]